MQHDSPRLRANNFDLLRLLFAGTVCLVHVHGLSGFSELEPVTRILSSGMAVKAFFVVSGFLIFMSFERSSSLWAYARKRVRRIYPAYFTVVMLCAIGLVAVSSYNIEDYFSSAWLKYVVANLFFLNFLHPTLPGVFEANKIPEVNGAVDAQDRGDVLSLGSLVCFSLQTLLAFLGDSRHLLRVSCTLYAHDIDRREHWIGAVCTAWQTTPGTAFLFHGRRLLLLFSASFRAKKHLLPGYGCHRSCDQLQVPDAVLRTVRPCNPGCLLRPVLVFGKFRQVRGLFLRRLHPSCPDNSTSSGIRLVQRQPLDPLGYSRLDNRNLRRGNVAPG